jgi:prepilin-type N-terminal cleavage/methylation domain-containing protein
MDELNKKRAESGSQSGQSLIELLVAMSIAGIFIGGVTIALDVALRSTTQSKHAQPASLLVQELLDTVAVAARANWQGSIAVLPLNTPYHIMNGVAVAGSESKTPDVNGLVYTRFFTVADVIPPDASRKLITVTATWPAGASIGTVTLARYVTRSQNSAFRQTDWSGDSGQSGLFIDAAKFAAQSGIIKVTDGGFIYLDGFSAP